MASDLINKYFRASHLPQIWCQGCGNGIILHDVVKAIDNLKLDVDKTVIVSGIGCSARAAGYLNFQTLHTTHGRAIAFATGIKMARPDLNVIVLAGDGDISAIGGNHLIHAARRNIDLTVVVFNNSIYGMTGGQYSPTTPTGDFGTTAPYGNIDRPFDIAMLSLGAGATYVAKGDCFHAVQTTKLIQDGISHKGFSIIDVAVICPTYYGRKNKKGSAVNMMTYQKENVITAEAASKLSESEKVGKIIVGKLCDKDYPEFTSEYQKIIDKVGGHHE